MRPATRPVPAEVISVADRLVGSLSLAQAGLLGLPLALAAVLLLAPPRLEVVAYKVCLVGGAGLIFCPLAARCRQRLIIDWLATIRRYGRRSRHWSLAAIPDTPVRSGPKEGGNG